MMDNIEQQIRASVMNGLSKPAIEALIGRSFTPAELQVYRKAKAIYDLQERKRRRDKKYEHLDGTSRVQKHRDKYSAIDKDFDEACRNINWERRREAEKSLGDWTRIYMCDGLALNEEPSEKGYAVLKQMEEALTAHQNYMICMGRGFGKSSYCICAALYAIATGIQDYVMIISHNGSSSSSLLADIWRVIEVPDSKFAQDYPAVCYPFSSLGGAFRRRQTYRGRSTSIKKNANSIVLATLIQDDGKPFPTSGSIITCRGIGSGIRGAKHGTKRPSLVLLDDLQDFESAQNPSQVEKLVEIIQKDILPLAGKERLSVLQTATPIVPDDLVQKIRDDKSWKTSIYPAIERYPDNKALWKKYFEIFDKENVEERDHAESLNFYRDNFDEMNKGVEVFNPKRYSEKDGHISAIQKLLELEHQIGEAAFQSEFQMNPKQMEFALPITQKIVSQRVGLLKEFEIPIEEVQYICAASDLNLSKYITTVIMAFTRKQTAHIIYHTFRRCKIPINIPEQDYFKRVYDLLGQHGRELKKLADEHGFKIQGWSIDANGVPFKPVLEFTKNSMSICGLAACGFIGQASHQFRSFRSSRLKEEVNRTLLCGDKDERTKIGTGHRYTYFDSDLFHEQVQKGFLTEIGNIGSISWYNGGNHTDWAIQVCAEKLMLKRARQDGTTEYHWKEIGDDHDALDAIGQCLATYASQGFSTGISGRSSIRQQRQTFKKRIKIV